MNSKANEILNDVIHTASQAILCEDEAVKRQAMADIIDALAGIIPFERSATAYADGRACRSATADADGRGRSPSAPRFKARFIGINAVDCFAGSVQIKGHKLTGFVEQESEPKDGDWFGMIYDNGVAVGHVGGIMRGKNFVRKMMIGAMRGIASHVGHHQRLNENRKLRAEISPDA